MKKIFTFLAASALVVLAASCAKEQQIAAVPAGEETTVEFTVATPELMTKAIADGNTVDKVSCNVYGSDGAIIADLSKVIGMAGGKATFSVRLVTGQTYSFLFWAYKDGAPYTLDAAKKTVEVSYVGASNDESRDAFYAYVADKKITSSVTETVTLKRPFAQVNFGVEPDDITAAKTAGYTVAKSSVKLTGLANKLNLVDGTVSGTVDAEFTIADLPDDTEKLTVNKKDYNYVATNYVLVGADKKQLSDVELKIYDANGAAINTISVPNVPLQGNYRTNILGNLFTSVATYNIVVNPGFNDPDYEKEIWDGVTVNEPEQDANGNYLITKASELAWVAQQANASTEDRGILGGKTFILQEDIDLCNCAWTPIGSVAHLVACTFDGNSKSIIRLNASADGADGLASAGLFGGIAGGTVKNLTVKDATVSSSHYAGALCGYVEGTSAIENCQVVNVKVVSTPELLSTGKYDNGDKVGALAGYVCDTHVTGCKVVNATVTGYRDLGGIVGYLSSSASLTNSSIENVTINVNADHNYKDYKTQSAFDAGSIIGENAATGEVSGNTGDATINYAGTATTQAELDNLIGIENATITLADGTYTLPGSAADGITIKGESKDAIIDATNIKSNQGPSWGGKNVKFENLTQKWPSIDYVGITSMASVAYSDCVIEGRPTMYATTATFDGCTFKQSVYDYCIWTYSSENITFTNCTFNTMGKAVKVYHEGGNGSQTATFDGCTFKATNVPEGKGKAAVEIDGTNPNGGSKVYNIVINKCTETGFVAGENSKDTMWNYDLNSIATVTVDGKVVYDNK